MNKWHWFILALGIVLVDQLTKWLAVNLLMPGYPFEIMPMFNFTLGFNKGVAFSFLNEAGIWGRLFTAGFSFIVSIILVVWIMRTALSDRLQLTALSFILGGAVGNLIDRAYSGYVVDFIQLYYKNYSWPIFNIADSAICIGAALLLVDLCKSRQR